MEQLPSTEHYELIITTDPEHEGLDCYGVHNKTTDVVEYYDNLLPRAYEAMSNMEGKYQEMNADMRGATKLELVGSDEDDAVEDVAH